MMRLLGNILVVDPLPLLSDLSRSRVDLSVRRTTILNHIDLFGFFGVARTFVSKRIPPGSTTSEGAKHEEEDRE